MKNQPTQALEVVSSDPLTPAVATGMDIATSRQAQEVQAAMVVAKRFPRNETLAISRIMSACQRLSLAESALYAYPRGDTTVSGPSIRLAEALAKGWGNIDFGVIELEQKHGESVVMAYAWDLETNTRSTKIFTVKHERKARGAMTVLTDPRDIYEMTANQGARRLRACILSVVPGDVTELAVVACEKTMKDGDKTPFAERLAKIVSFFQGFNVNVAQIEKRLGHKIDTTNETELVTLRKICKTLDDNAGKAEDYFDFTAVGKSAPSKPEHTIDAGTRPTATEAAQSEPAPKDTTGGRAEAPRETPTEKAQDQVESETLIKLVASLEKKDGVTRAQVITYGKKAKLCSRMCESLEDWTNAKLKVLTDNWPHIIELIRKS